jgi:hypothetical protein
MNHSCVPWRVGAGIAGGYEFGGLSACLKINTIKVDENLKIL